MTYTLGIDVSTTGVKGLIVDASGVVRAEASREHALSCPHPMWSEQDPEDWWSGVRGVIRDLLAHHGIGPSNIAGIGLTGQMHGLVLLDEEGDVIRPAILWNDQRTARQCALIHERFGRDRLIQGTGNEALTGLTLPKLLWVAENEPEAYARVAHVLLPKDYVRYRLTDSFATDKAGAAGTLMLDLASRDWSEEILSTFSVSADWLPRTHEGPEITGRIDARGAAETGLAEGTPVVGGAGDQAAQAVGVGAVGRGDVAVTIGTSGVVFCSTPHPQVDRSGRLQAFCHALPGTWHLMGVMLSAAGSLRWLRDTVAPSESFDTLVKPAASVPVGSNGLLFLPYLTGERMPYPDPRMRGAFVGLTSRHSRAHLVRAVMEGVSFGLCDGLRLLEASCGSSIAEVRVSGGGARSPVWCQILADALAVDVLTVSSREGAAFGAALLAGVGCGLWQGVEDACARTIRVEERVRPNPTSARAYERMYDLYRDGYPSCRDLAHGLTSCEEAMPS